MLLNIDTATENASVSITLNGVSIAYLCNEHQKEHASFVHTATERMLRDVGYKINDIEAFSVTSGPGSYTGLRVGMATAKGFCYGLKKPFIAINTLEVMAKAAIDTASYSVHDYLFCPMIDARRMEVFTALYNNRLEVVLAPGPVILEEKMFDIYMTNKKILFFGSGSGKFRELPTNKNAVFVDVQYNAKNLGTLADKAFHERRFTDIPYSEPDYFKDFHSTIKR